MTILILHQAGVGFWPCGAVITIEDRRAQGLIKDGYAVLVEKSKASVKQKDEPRCPSKA